MIFKYEPEGVCSQMFEIDIDNNVINNLTVYGGCNGNLKGISSLLKGMNVDDAISRLEGIKCGYKQTSCPDQISKALNAYKKSL